MAEVDKAIAERRGFLKAAGGCAAAAAASVASSAFGMQEVVQSPRPTTFSKVVDLTHTLTSDFPAWFTPGEKIGDAIAPPALTATLDMSMAEGMPADLYKVSYWEHVGTHVDSPNHFGGEASVDRIPAKELVAPLVVVDIARRAEKDPLTRLTPEDLKAWETRHGRIPDGAFVALRGGWDRKVKDRAAFLNRGPGGEIRQPGFHPDATRMLLEDRSVVAIGMDGLNFDNPANDGFPVHLMWLPAGRWGVENLKDLDKLPAAGATIIVGAPKFEGGTGGPSRVLALA
jgi:kynurenine formamidase